MGFTGKTKLVTLLFKDGHHEEREFPEEIEACESISYGDFDAFNQHHGQLFRRVWTRTSKGRVDFFLEDGTPPDVSQRFVTERFG